MAVFVLVTFLACQGMVFDFEACGQELFPLPQPGTRVHLSADFQPALLKGLRVDPQNPLHVEFILDTGMARVSQEDLKAESARLIRYFLTSITIPDKDLWVNLSPYESGRIIPDAFGETEMGRDLLAQDYLLKQITASVIYPEEQVGKEFWAKVYAEARRRYGKADIPVNTFNKVWIVPEKAVVYEHQDSAYVVEGRLKVLLEEDYLALEKGVAGQAALKQASSLGADITREVVIPILEQEVNEGRNFAPLRQIYHSQILAVWFKDKIKASLFGKVYVDQRKTGGVDIEDKSAKDKIWAQYVEAFQKGVYNYIREDVDPVTEKRIPRKYFAGGAGLYGTRDVVSQTQDRSALPQDVSSHVMVIETGFNFPDRVGSSDEPLPDGPVDVAQGKDSSKVFYDSGRVDEMVNEAHPLVEAWFKQHGYKNLSAVDKILRRMALGSIYQVNPVIAQVFPGALVYEEQMLKLSRPWYGSLPAKIKGLKEVLRIGESVYSGLIRGSDYKIHRGLKMFRKWTGVSIPSEEIRVTNQYVPQPHRRSVLGHVLLSQYSGIAVPIIVHEFFHHGFEGFRSSFWMDEGMTQYLMETVFRKEEVSTTRAVESVYSYEKNSLSIIAKSIGFEPLIIAYMTGDISFVTEALGENGTIVFQLWESLGMVKPTQRDSYLKIIMNNLDSIDRLKDIGEAISNSFQKVNSGFGEFSARLMEWEKELEGHEAAVRKFDLSLEAREKLRQLIDNNGSNRILVEAAENLLAGGHQLAVPVYDLVLASPARRTEVPEYVLDDFDFPLLREKLKQINETNTMLWALLGITESYQVEGLTNKKIVKMINRLRKSETFYKEIDADQYKSSLPVEARRLLELAQAGGKGFIPEDYIRLNDALLGRIFISAIKRGAVARGGIMRRFFRGVYGKIYRFVRTGKFVGKFFPDPKDYLGYSWTQKDEVVLKDLVGRRRKVVYYSDIGFNSRLPFVVADAELVIGVDGYGGMSKSRIEKEHTLVLSSAGARKIRVYEEGEWDEGGKLIFDFVFKGIKRRFILYHHSYSGGDKFYPNNLEELRGKKIDFFLSGGFNTVEEPLFKAGGEVLNDDGIVLAPAFLHGLIPIDGRKYSLERIRIIDRGWPHVIWYKKGKETRDPAEVGGGRILEIVENQKNQMETARLERLLVEIKQGLFVRASEKFPLLALALDNKRIELQSAKIFAVSGLGQAVMNRSDPVSGEKVILIDAEASSTWTETQLSFAVARELGKIFFEDEIDVQSNFMFSKGDALKLQETLSSKLDGFAWMIMRLTDKTLTERDYWEVAKTWRQEPGLLRKFWNRIWGRGDFFSVVRRKSDTEVEALVFQNSLPGLRMNVKLAVWRDWKNAGISRNVGEVRGAREVENQWPSDPDRSVQQSADFAKGGIDLTRDTINLQVRRFGESQEWIMDPALLQRFKESSGLQPVIINIYPMKTSVSMFLE